MSSSGCGKTTEEYPNVLSCGPKQAYEMILYAMERAYKTHIRGSSKPELIHGLKIEHSGVNPFQIRP